MKTEFAARHTCDSPEWYTPREVVEAARKVMGRIDLDPASHAEANVIVQATRYFTAEDDGLVQEWSGRVFLNPPGGLVQKFWAKLMRERQYVEQAIWIGYSLEQLQTLQRCPVAPFSLPICITAKRIAFIENTAKRAARLAKIDAENALRATTGERLKKRNEKSDAPSHSNYITYIGSNTDAFVREFSRFGQVRC